MLTDVRISLQPLAEESKTGPFGVSEGPPACFDLEKKARCCVGVSTQMVAFHFFHQYCTIKQPAQGTLSVRLFEQMQSEFCNMSTTKGTQILVNLQGKRKPEEHKNLDKAWRQLNDIQPSP